MDNKTMARLLAETADLLEIDGADSFRIRSYRRAAEAAEQTTVDLAARRDTARLLEIDGIGKGMAAHLQAIAATGTLPQRDELLAKYGAGVLELLKLPGMGPKTVALLWDAAQDRQQYRPARRGDRGGAAERACRAWAPSRLKSCARGSRTTGAAPGRFRIDVAEEEAGRIAAYLLKFKGIERVTPGRLAAPGTGDRGRPGPAGDGAGLRAGEDRGRRGVRGRVPRHSRT